MDYADQMNREYQVECENNAALAKEANEAADEYMRHEITGDDIWEAFQELSDVHYNLMALHVLKNEEALLGRFIIEFLRKNKLYWEYDKRNLRWEE